MREEKKYHSAFCVGYQLLDMEPTHKCLYNQGRSSVGKKIIFSFTSSYDLERVSQSGIGDCVQFPLQLWHLVWHHACGHAATVSVSSCMTQFCSIRKRLFPLFIHPPSLSQAFSLLFPSVPWTLKGGIEEGVPFQTVFHSLSLFSHCPAGPCLT